MPFTIPTLEQALARARERMRAELPGTDAAIWPNTNYVYSKVWAGEAWELYHYLSWISRQRFATTADGDMLDAHGAQFNLARKSAAPARGYADITGTALTTILEGTQFARSDGALFELKITITLDSNGDGRMLLEAVDDGAAGNTVGGTELTPVVDNANIATVAVDEDGLGGGAATENDDSYRARILHRMRYPPHGGAAHDYVFWSLEIAGVTRVWVDPLAWGPGTVGVWFMADDNGSAYGLPSVSLVADVDAYIQTQRPVTARVVVAAPQPAEIDVFIAGLGTPSQDTQTRIEGELKDVFRRSVQVSMPNAPFVLRNNVLWQAVARATGDSVHNITTPQGDVSLGPGVIPVLRSICYQPT